MLGMAQFGGTLRPYIPDASRGHVGGDPCDQEVASEVKYINPSPEGEVGVNSVPVTSRGDTQGDASATKAGSSPAGHSISLRRTPSPEDGERRERPILFKSEMVRAILDGRKTVTRRVLKPQPKFDTEYWIEAASGEWVPKYEEDDGGSRFATRCPYGQPGDRLLVRETWRHSPSKFCRCGYPTDACDTWKTGEGCDSIERPKDQ